MNIIQTANKVDNTTYTIATTDGIPTNYVTTDTYQNISGSKSFTKTVLFRNILLLINDRDR